MSPDAKNLLIEMHLSCRILCLSQSVYIY